MKEGLELAAARAEQTAVARSIRHTATHQRRVELLSTISGVGGGGAGGAGD